MAITIEGVPEYLTRDQWTQLFRSFGFDPNRVMELRMAPDGVHAAVAADDPQHPYDTQTGKPYRHTVFIPVRDNPDDVRTARVRRAAQQIIRRERTS